MKFCFPENFLFGAASSACQIESAAYEGGKGEDVIGHYYSKLPEKFHGADPNDSADFYHRYREDIEMMKELGLDAFRFSISWSRIFPNGPEESNPAGIAYYNDMIDALKDAGIVTFFDLFHCDLPYWVIEKGGILNPEFIRWFETYAKTCFKELGCRVDYWCTVNEPSINCFGAYANESNAPFLKDMDKAIRASHNMLLAHYSAIRLYKSMNLQGKIGAVIHVEPNYALSLDAMDKEAAGRNFDFYSGWWLDPMLLGHYPESLMDYPYLTDKLPANFKKELSENFVENDYIAINYYSPAFARYKKNGELGLEIFHNEKLARDDYGFFIYPPGLYDTLLYLKQEYPGKEIIIAENGISRKKCGDLELELDDEYRIDYMREHLREVSRAIASGAPVRGYFHWSIMDTNEAYAGGYDHIFGLVQINYKTLERRRRKSWYYYQNLIKNREVD